MIRLFHRSDLPYLAYVGQEEGRIAVAIHSYAQHVLSLPAREALFNQLVREMERSTGSRINVTVTDAGGHSVVVQLDDMRERRTICRTLAEGLAVRY